MLVAESRDTYSELGLVFDQWYCCRCSPGSISHPDQLPWRRIPTRDSSVSNSGRLEAYLTGDWIAATVPGTVAGALNDAGQWDMRHPPEIDKYDWWYRTNLAALDIGEIGQPCWLYFDGLATLAEVWLNGELLFESDNMFRVHQVEVSKLLRADNELVIGFRSLSQDLQKKRPRPRWKTNLVDHQQLRWRRTTLLGRIPGWSPPVPAIGPWRAIRIESSPISLTDLRIQSRVDGSAGIVTVQGDLQSTIVVDRILLYVGPHECPIEIPENCDSSQFQTELRITDVPLWWPHTHGQQPLLPCKIIVESGLVRQEFDCGQIGFRKLRVENIDDFSIELNGQTIYCRGACWTISNVFTLNGTEQSLRRDLTLARDAGANMLRVIGTMIYESELFYRLCDELGIMVWQDFMFANMDYPIDDPSFAENMTAEAVGQLRRLSRHPSVVVYCGNSEVEQQAAMLGIPRELWRNDWFSRQLPELCSEHHPGTAYIPSTPCGGVLPFHSDSGISHFYGVGAYLRSPAELRQSNVKFTPECLGFANIPELEMVNTITGGALPVIHHPAWKQRVPRDSGAGWDFDDVRDHYLKQVYGLDPVALRSTDMNRYLELSRLVSGEMMSQTFAEWRSCHTQNRGALVWFFKDLWPAAGWGILDSSGEPKAAYYALKRVWQSRQITLTDEGLNGLHLHVTNETAEALTGFVEVTLLKEPNVVVATNNVSIDIARRGQRLLNVDEILGSFYDVSYAYRFGPPHHDVVIASLLDSDRTVISEAFHFVRRRESFATAEAIETAVEMTSESDCCVRVRADRFLHNVRMTAKGFVPDDNHFHLAPGRTKFVRFSTVAGSPKTFRAELEAVNLESSITVSVAKN